MPDQLSSQVCQICGDENRASNHVVKEMMFGFRDEFFYFVCARCECLQIAEFPPNISKYYPKNYYSFANNAESKFNGSWRIIRLLGPAAWVFNRTWYHRLLQNFYSPISLRILKNLRVSVETRLLDIGCGNGQKFLYPLAELGLKNIVGCDPFIQSDIKYANGLNIYKADIFSMKGKWDIITYHHVFEHIPDPLENLMKVNELLTDDGVCILRMPTVSSFAWQHYKEHWVQLDAPRHYFLYSIKGVQYMADKVGLTLFKVEFDSTYKQFADSERYRLDEPLITPRKPGLLNFLRRKLKKNRYKKMARKMNKMQKGDQAAFFLKKTSASIKSD